MKNFATKPLKNIFAEEELLANSVVANFATTAADGKIYQTTHYNLDVIISVGYRVNSKRGTQFRQWAAKVLKDYLIRGYAVNQKQISEQSLHHLQQTITLLSDTLRQQNLVDEVSYVALLKLENTQLH